MLSPWGSVKKNALAKQDKKSNQKIHFKKRYLERTGQTCNNTIMKEILEKINNHDLELVDKQSRRVLIFKYLVDEKEYVVIFDKIRNSLVTIISFAEFSEGKMD
jgi:hypothetical protein